MSKKINNIDQIARQKLFGAKVEPPASAWDRLLEDLDRSRTKKRLVFFRKLAAGLAILISLGLIFFSPIKVDHPISNNQIDADTKGKKLLEIKSLPIKFFKDCTSDKTPSKIIAPAKSITPPLETAFPKKVKIAHLNFINAITPVKSSNRNFTFIANRNLNKKEGLDFDWSKYKYSEETEISKKNKKNWKIGLGCSPSYASAKSSTGDMFSADNTGYFFKVDDELKPSFSFGANFSYSLSSRWSLLSGVYYLNQKNKIHDFYVFENNKSFKSEFLTKSSFGNIKIENSDALFNNADFYNKIELTPYSNVSNSNSDLIQEFEFIEIPLLISYALIKNKWTIAVVTGFNTGILVGNKVYLKDFESEKVGFTENINKLIFKSVIGLSFEYPLSNRLYLTLSPIYKYQLNRLDKESKLNGISEENYHLKFFDFKTGISYHF